MTQPATRRAPAVPVAPPAAAPASLPHSGQVVGPPAGQAIRWVIDSSRSSLKVSVKVGLFAVHGRFGDVTGVVEVAGDRSGAVSVLVPTTSLTSGNVAMDGMLRAAGIIDMVANPVIAFDSHEVRRDAHGWTVHGMLTTTGGVLDTVLDLDHPSTDTSGALVFRARGALPTRDAVRLLSCAGVDRLLGRRMELDLQVFATQS